MRAEERTGHALELLGGARLYGPGGRVDTLERKTAALLAYLALAGATPRAHLAALLWPDSPRATARNNLRQLLRRLRELAGASLVEDVGEELLRLSPGVRCDAAELEVCASAGRYVEASRREGELLAGLSYDDCADLSEWLRERREHLRELRRRACEEEAARLEREGQLKAALEWNRRVLEQDPLFEAAHRRSMRLHYLLGDRAGALRAYDRCRAALLRELDAEPMPETQALARELERGQLSPPPAPQAQVAVPLSVLRPRVLVGRERAWAQLEAGLAARQFLFVVGDAGVGKSRLVTEFAQARGGRALHVTGRPGDTAVPFAYHARLLRALLDQRPDAALAPWVRRELARLLPELGEASPPVQSATDKLRFFEATLELLRALAGEVSLIVADDLHYVDTATFEATAYLLTRAADADAASAVPPLLATLRPGEAAPEVERHVQRLVEAGLAVRVELAPLAPPEVAALLQGVGVPHAASLAEPLARMTGGNPFFIVEMLKTLLESGQLPQGVPATLQVPQRVSALLVQRLGRLSLPALQLARTMAAAQDAFSLELAGQLLEVSPASLSHHWEELLLAQVVRDSWFAHDLLFEAVVQHTPEPVRLWLHRRLAELLTARGAPAAIIARHWMGADELEKATPHLQQALQESALPQPTPLPSSH